MKRNTAVIIVVAALLAVAAGWGGYTWYKKANTPPEPVLYKTASELDSDIQRLEGLKKAKGLSWQDNYRLAVAYIQRGRSNDALPILEEVAAKRPNFSKTFESLGMVYYRTDKLDKAIEAWDKALKLNGKAEFLKEMIERAKRKQGVLSRVSVLEKEVQADSGAWQKRFELAVLYLSLKRVEEASSQLSKALESKKDSPEIYDGIAEINAIRGDFDRAVEAEKKAVRLDPKNEVYKKRLAEMEKVREGIKKGSPR